MLGPVSEKDPKGPPRHCGLEEADPEKLSSDSDEGGRTSQLRAEGQEERRLAEDFCS